MRLLIVDVSRVLGLFPFDRKGKFKKRRFYYCIFIVMAFLGAMSVFRAKTFSIKVSTRSFQQNISNALQILQVTTLIVHLISMGYHRQNVELFQYHHQSRKCSCCSYCLVFPLLGVFFVCLVPYGMYPVKTSIFNKFFVTFIEIDNFFNLLVVLQYSHMLKSAFQPPEIVFGTNRPISKIDFYMGEKLEDDVQSLAKIYGWQMLLIYINSFGWLIWGMYYILWAEHFKNSISSMVWLVVSVIEKIITLSVPCEASERFYRRMDEHYDRLFRIIRDNPVLYKEASLFLYITQKQKAKLTVCGFFTLGYPLITSIITGSVTYLVVLIQFGTK